MSSRRLSSLSLALGLALLLAPSLVALPHAATPGGVRSGTALSAAQHTTIASRYGQLPLAFEVNQGQDADPSVRFVAHGGGYSLALTPAQALLALTRQSDPMATPAPFALPGQPAAAAPMPSATLGMAWLGANPHPVVTGEQRLPGTVNYFIGNDPKQWHTNIPTYQQVRLHDVYPGVDLVYHSSGGQLEYDFVVAPGADPGAIQLGFTGASGLGVDLAGNLSLALPGGAIAQDKPLVYQAINGARQPVAGGYTLTRGQHVSFALGAYNPHLPLVIDPAYQFSTYLGGNAADDGDGIAVDSGGDAYVTGTAQSTDFPTVNPFQATDHGIINAFITKFNAAGSALIYSTYLGGSKYDYGLGIAVDSGGNAYITGAATSSDFPTLGGFQTTNHGGGDAFVTKLNPSGAALVYSTYLGGSDLDIGFGIAVDSGGDAYVTGQTYSSDFPVGGGMSAAFGGVSDAFVTKINPSGATYQYSDFLGGGDLDIGFGIAVDSSGNAYVTGRTSSTNFPTTAGAFQTSAQGGNDAFVSKLNANGTAFVYSTYLGGGNDDEGHAIAVDSAGDAYVCGDTSSTNFPVLGAVQATNHGGEDAFVTKLNPSGAALVYSTYLGGSNTDAGKSIAVDANGAAAVTGQTSSTDFPLANPLQKTLLDSNGNVFVSRLDPSGAILLFSTYLGGSNGLAGDEGNGIAQGADGTVYVTGTTQDSDFPTANALYAGLSGGDDAFVTKIDTLPSVDTTTGVFRPSNGTLYLKEANTTGPADITLAYGLPGDQPITGDWTGQGYKSIGVYRNGTFYLRNSNTTGNADIVVPFGTSGDIPVAGDWTGKGYDSIGVFRPSTATFYLRSSNTAGPPDLIVTFGASGDIPLAGDWTAKGYDSVGVFRPRNGNVFLRNTNTTGGADISFTFGVAGDKPVVGDWDANGTDTIGVDRNGLFLLRNRNTTGPANISFYLGISGDEPIAGYWPPPSSPPHGAFVSDRSYPRT